MNGSFFDGGHGMGIGSLCRDSARGWAFGFEGLQAGGNPFQAEALVFQTCLSQAWSKGFRRVEVETDCRELLEVIEDDFSRRCDANIREIKAMVNQDWVVTIPWIPRECNLVIDWLARTGSGCQSLLITMLEAPHVDLESLLLRDSLLVP